NPQTNIEREKLQGDEDTLLYHQSLPLMVHNLKEGGSIYIWFAGKHLGTIWHEIEATGVEIRNLLIWNKINAHYGAIFARYKQRHEPCIYAVKGAAKWFGASNEVTVWDIVQPSKNEWHPTQKPINCMARAIKNSSEEGDKILDPFAGSGTTLLAAKKLRRK